MSQFTVDGGSSEVDDIGPVEYLIVEFPAGRVSAAGFDTLLDLAERDVLRVLDLEFVAKAPGGTVSQVELADAVAGAKGDLSAFLGSSSGLLDDDDFERVAELIEPGSLAGILVYENTWAAALASAARRGGARVVSTGQVPLSDLDAALDHIGG